MKYIIWFSGGIDSTYTSWKLKNQWHEVLLVYLHNFWELEPGKKLYLNNIAEKLWCNFEIVDIRKEFKDLIIDDFVHHYKIWKTPNPCVLCNPLVKFDILERIRQKYSFDKIATGHYAKIVNIDNNSYIAAADDEQKEQSYMLYRLENQSLVENIEFVLWKERKTKIKKKLQDLEIPVVSGESQDICFIKDWDYINFIKNYSKFNNKEWNILDKRWNIIWKHKWIIYYTIGQRKWLGINTKYYVIDIDVRDNAIIVWDEKDLFKESIEVWNYFIKEELLVNKDFVWEDVYAKIRYKSSPQKIKSIEKKWDKIIITFAEKVKAPTKGQHCVFYKRISSQNIVVWWWEIY